MPKGFSYKQQTKLQYIKNFVKNSKRMLSGFETLEEAKTQHSKKWYELFASKHNNYTRRQLLSPVHRELEIIDNPFKDTHWGSNYVLMGFNGIWRISVQERSDKSLDFEIAVWAGETYRFHSEVIRDSILSRFTDDTYKSWKAMVKDDIPSLKHLVREVQSQIDLVPWSYTCSPSSARLCEQVGISTYRGAAFLFPQSYLN